MAAHTRWRPERTGGARLAETSLSTTDHDEIRRWVDERAVVPATDGAGVLRIKFPGALVYQDATSDGETSTFNKVVSRD